MQHPEVGTLCQLHSHVDLVLHRGRSESSASITFASPTCAAQALPPAAAAVLQAFRDREGSGLSGLYCKVEAQIQQTDGGNPVRIRAGWRPGVRARHCSGPATCEAAHQAWKCKCPLSRKVSMQDVLEGKLRGQQPGRPGAPEQKPWHRSETCKEWCQEWKVRKPGRPWY